MRRDERVDVDAASQIIIRPYSTERIFEMLETESKICFIVDRKATKGQIAQAIYVLYKKEAIEINTARTIYGKKAFVKFDSVEKARDLATDVGVM